MIEPRRLAVILVRPDSPENIGLVARAMKNTGFSDLRLAGIARLDPRAAVTAVHASDVLGRARLFPGVAEAVADLRLVLASTARPRAEVGSVGLAEALERIARLPAGAPAGILFGNERTGLTAEEIRRANVLFTIPQAARQPSYNIAAAVLLTLFPLFERPGAPLAASAACRAAAPAPPLPRREQEKVIALILANLEAKGFVRGGNRDHVSNVLFDLFGRMEMTARDRRFLLAVFQKGVPPRPPKRA